jgi:hypothetical protein
MINENAIFLKAAEDSKEKMTKEFTDFIKANEFTSAQMDEAYLRMLGASESDSQDPDIEKIAMKMEEMSQNGFPTTKMTEIIGIKRTYENAVPTYHEFIDCLEISDKEKRVLLSIVDRKRSGEIECYVDNEVISSFKINTVDVPVELVAFEVSKSINKIITRLPKGKKYAFAFSEN